MAPPWLARLSSRLCVLAPWLPFAACGGGIGPMAPSITNLHVEPRITYESPLPVMFTVGFELFDPNRDVVGATFMLRTAGGQLVHQDTIPLASAAPGVSIAGAAIVPLLPRGTFTVELWTTDAAGLLSNALATTVDVVPYPWSELPPDPVSRTFAAAATLADQVYVLGGSRQDLGVFPGPATALVARLDPATGAWSASPPLTVARRALAAAVAGGRLYAIGGEAGPSAIGTITDGVECFDPATQSWMVVAPMPTARAYAGAAAVGDRIYVVGGAGSSGINSPLDTVESYNTATDTWTVEAPLPHARFGARVAAFGGRLVVLGGFRNQSIAENRVDVLDPATGTWSNELLFFDRICTYAVVAADRLYAGGAETGFSGTWLFRADGADLATWRGLTASRQLAGVESSATAADGCIFVFGYQTAERYRLVHEIR